MVVGLGGHNSKVRVLAGISGQSERCTDYTNPRVRGWKEGTCDIRVVVVFVVVVALGLTSMKLDFHLTV